MTWTQKSPLEWELQGTTKRVSWDQVKGKESLVAEDDAKQCCVIIPLPVLVTVFRAQGIELQNSNDLERSIVALQELFMEKQALADRIVMLEAEIGVRFEQCRSLTAYIKSHEETIEKAANLVDRLTARANSLEIALGSERDQKNKIIKIASTEIERLKKLAK
jgi:uncharacterized coiled-coil protein SlyX